jgi:uroporphyrinogen decarboxylase
MNGDGVILLEKDNAGSIPAEIEHLLVDRKSWEELYLPKMQFSEERIDHKVIESYRRQIEQNTFGDRPAGIHIGSLFGTIRNWLGVEGASYLYCDDEALYDEIIDTMGNLCYRVTKATLETGIRFDFAHFWEDICFKNGPLVIPSVFEEKVGPHYKKITGLLHEYGIDIISLDCDGCIDALIPTWLDNGVNTMFPIEVGTWNASIAPWREKYGRQIRGVGGMKKAVFAEDYSAVDAEIERLKPLVELGGYIPCPDHRIAPDAKWENVQYYAERYNLTFNR